MKLFFLDIETTGVKYWKNSIHQISGCIEINDELKETFDFRVCPFPGSQIEDDALKQSNVTKEIILAYPLMIDVYRQIISLLSKYIDKYDRTDKFFLVGYNCASFDNQFFRAWFVQNGDNYFGSWFWSSTLDVMVLAAEYLKHRRHTMIDFKLKTVAAELGIGVEESRLHDAGYDIGLTRQIYHLVTQKQEQEISQPF